MNRLSTIILILLFLSSCEKEDPVIPNEEELITTLIYTLTPATGGSPVVFSFRDEDGDGGIAPEISIGDLVANTEYNGSLVLRNELVIPADNITEEIEEENEEHQFFFTTTLPDLLISYADMDANGNPIGLATEIATGSSGTGILTIILRHEPDKSASGVSSGNIENAGGETDLEVTFPVNVQ